MSGKKTKTQMIPRVTEKVSIPSWTLTPGQGIICNKQGFMLRPDHCNKQGFMLRPDHCDAETAGQVNAARAMYQALSEAVEKYGKPGGPWNVPGEPGSWIAKAKEALRIARGEE